MARIGREVREVRVEPMPKQKPAEKPKQPAEKPKRREKVPA